MRERDESLPFLRTILASPNDSTPRKVYADWLQERDCESEAVWWRGLPERKPPKVVMDTKSATLQGHLEGCTFAVGSWDKKFVREVFSSSDADGDVRLTVKQWVWIRVLALRYRRQWACKQCLEYLVSLFGPEAVSIRKAKVRRA